MPTEFFGHLTGEVFSGRVGCIVSAFYPVFGDLVTMSYAYNRSNRQYSNSLTVTRGHLENAYIRQRKANYVFSLRQSKTRH